ncbi:MAG: response regulator [Labilithrix sp.]|nr:response regulator [Labilithrix sp.]
MTDAAPQARILVVDDDPAGRTGLAKLLALDGYLVTSAASGEAALESVAEAFPDLVLTDVQMPGMHGVELCSRLQELDPELPVIVMTAHSAIESAVASLRAGATDYLVKPLSYDAVLWVVQKALAARTASRELDALRKRHEQQREEYLALVSHDLLNPLNNILMCVSVLKESLDKQGLVNDSKLAARAERNVARMTGMLTELTEATSLESGIRMTPSLVRCDVRELVRAAIEGIGEAGSRRITMEGDGAPCEVLADAGRLERIVVNLLTNALKYSPDDAPVLVRVARRGHGVDLTVTDRGIGIPAESLTLLFDRYYRAKGGKARATGLGLGLYIARQMVEALGGQIGVSSEPGAGSAFTVTIPALAA